MQQDDQEKRSTTNGSSRSGSVIGDKEEKKLVDEVDGEEEEDLQQIEDSSIEEVDKRRREKGSERNCLTNFTLDINDDDLLDYDKEDFEEDVLWEGMSTVSDSAPSEAGEQEMSMAISKPVSFCKFNLLVHFCLVVFYSYPVNIYWFGSPLPPRCFVTPFSLKSSIVIQLRTKYSVRAKMSQNQSTGSGHSKRSSLIRGTQREILRKRPKNNNKA